MSVANVKSFGNGFLDSLSYRSVEAMVPLLQSLKLSKDRHLYQQGQTADWIYFPVTAVLSKFGILEDGSTIEVAMTGREGAVGLASALGSNGAINHSQVIIPGTAYRVARTHFLRMLSNDPSLNYSVTLVLEGQLRHMSKRMACSRFHSVEQRLSMWLLMLRERSQEVRMPVTHEQMARALGVHRPTVTELTMSLRDRGMIAYSRGRISITDPVAMRGLACDCFDDLSIPTD